MIVDGRVGPANRVCPTTIIWGFQTRHPDMCRLCTRNAGLPPQNKRSRHQFESASNSMATISKNSSALATNRRRTLARQRVGSNVITLQSIGTTANRSSLRHPEQTDRSHASSLGATLIPFRPRSTTLTRSALPTRQGAGEYAKADIGNFDESTTREDDYGQRMFESLVAAAWLGTLIIAGYYVFNALL
jgi:hypothetical protein